MVIPSRREAEGQRRVVRRDKPAVVSLPKKSKDFLGDTGEIGLDSFGIVTPFPLSRVFSEAHVPRKHRL